MKQVLFDTNIVLDIALKRDPFYQDASQLFSLIDAGNISVHITATTITDIYYISRKQKGHESSISFIKGLIDIVEIIGINKNVIISALESETIDFEDAVQEVAATRNQVETIITRNKKDFKGGVEVLTPKEFLTKYSTS